MSEQTETKTRAWYLKPKAIITAIAAVIFLILIFQNWESVSVDLFFMTDKEVPAALLYIAFSLIGFGVGWIVRRPKAAGASAKKTQ